MNTKKNPTSWLMPSLVIGLMLITFFPIIFWVGQNIMLHEQLKSAFSIWAACAIILWVQSDIKIQRQFELSNKVLLLWALGISSILIAKYIQIPSLNLAALCFTLSALALSFLGTKAERYVFSFSVAMAFFLLLLQFLHIVDWPLRIFAGKMSAYGLDLLGKNAELNTIRSQEEFQLIMRVNNRPFHVAAECNGFGLFSSSLMMAIIFTLYTTRDWLDKILSTFLSILIALLVNAVRITIIVLLAPLVGAKYILMHEIVGFICFYLGLGFVYWICRQKKTPL